MRNKKILLALMKAVLYVSLIVFTLQPYIGYFRDLILYPSATKLVATCFGLLAMLFIAFIFILPLKSPKDEDTGPS